MRLLRLQKQFHVPLGECWLDVTSSRRDCCAWFMPTQAWMGFLYEARLMLSCSRDYRPHAYSFLVAFPPTAHPSKLLGCWPPYRPDEKFGANLCDLNDPVVASQIVANRFGLFLTPVIILEISSSA